MTSDLTKASGVNLVTAGGMVHAAFTAGQLVESIEQARVAFGSAQSLLNQLVNELCGMEGPFNDQLRESAEDMVVAFDTAVRRL